MTRLEVRELRKQRVLEQASLATAEAQCSRLSAALSCAEEDLRTLREALSEESCRARAWQVPGHHPPARAVPSPPRRHTHDAIRIARECLPPRRRPQEQAMLLENDMRLQEEAQRAELRRRAAAHHQALSRPPADAEDPGGPPDGWGPDGARAEPPAARRTARRVSMDPALGWADGGAGDGGGGQAWACGISANVARRPRCLPPPGPPRRPRAAAAPPPLDARPRARRRLLRRTPR
jgi:hypothetical protein